MLYTIKIKYNSEDCFDNKTIEVEELDGNFTEEIAKENIARIKQYYEREEDANSILLLSPEGVEYSQILMICWMNTLISVEAIQVGMSYYASLY